MYIYIYIYDTYIHIYIYIYNIRGRRDAALWRVAPWEPLGEEPVP